ncbi:NUDIX hydrolase [Ottowia testudinis]|uniref:CoA pyrophosphatase n=1 Tax=Ottowia testudinis TaxID=2816950 RepID=A0A975H7E5_9BURK|nr:CoA pyrophosphatase [Ottowia testudinis]QTD46967.1 CoA pyrophosphatase [Ottowia testudinis]
MTLNTSLSKLPNFNPRHVPVTGVDAHLPAVPAERLTPAALRQRFITPPAWRPELREEPRFADRAPAAAAVLVPLVDRPSGLSVLLTERTANLSTHSGQVAFPGGKVDPEDLDAVDAALREAQEEVDLQRGFVDVLGQLPVYVTGTQFIVTPVVAVVRPGFVLHPNPGEVAHAFEVPLSFLMNPAHHRRHRFEWDGQVREWFSMPYVERVRVDRGAGESPPTPDSEVERYIWGATAGMLRNFYRFLSA